MTDEEIKGIQEMQDLAEECTGQGLPVVWSEMVEAYRIGYDAALVADKAEVEQAHSDNAALIADRDYYKRRAEELRSRFGEQVTKCQKLKVDSDMHLKLYAETEVALVTVGKALGKDYDANPAPHGWMQKELVEEVERLKASAEARRAEAVELDNRLGDLRIELCDLLGMAGDRCDTHTEVGGCERCIVECVGQLKSRQLPDGCEWPVDADGQRIEVGDSIVFLNEPRSRCDVIGIKLTAVIEDGTALSNPENWHHVVPEPADSWAKLEEDAAKSSCAYYENVGKPCDGCPADSSNSGGQCYMVMHADLIRRAKALAGVE